MSAYDKTSALPHGQIQALDVRLDNIQVSARLILHIGLIACGGFFEIYDLALTAFLPPGLVAANVFHSGAAGMFGLSDQASFIAATFFGLYIGVIGFAAFGDRFGRKIVFGYALIWYTMATLCIGAQHHALGVCAWRFVAGIGLGAEAVAIDCYIVELVPKRLRGKAFGFSIAFQYLAIPFAALLAAVLVPSPHLGLAGWRWMTIIPAVGAAAVWVLRRRLPESPRWLLARGRIAEATAIVESLEAPAPGVAIPPLSESLPESAQPPPDKGYMLRALSMMSIYSCFQGIGFYGFGNWLPTLLEARGVPLKHSLIYSAGVVLAAPVAPFIFAFLSDKFERKYQIIVCGLAIVIFGLLFSQASTAAGWIAFGFALSFSNALIGFHSHTYQSEIFPTSVRARAIGFVYSFTRLTAAMSGYLVAYVLTHFGVTYVFITLSLCMLVAVLSVAVAGPRTRNRSFRQISGNI